MHKKIEKYLITPNMMVSDAIESIVLNHERLVFVADKNKKLLGTLSEGDVLKMLLQKKSLDMPVSNAMNKSFIFLNINEKSKARKIFKDKGVTMIPIVKKNMIIASIIKITDLIN
tara:strand:+ start:94 stop:438 length:345 start_codon:yes stop_codon:yes gene_type:complete